MFPTKRHNYTIHINNEQFIIGYSPDILENLIETEENVNIKLNDGQKIIISKPFVHLNFIFEQYDYIKGINMATIYTKKEYFTVETLGNHILEYLVYITNYNNLQITDEHKIINISYYENINVCNVYFNKDLLILSCQNNNYGIRNPEGKNMANRLPLHENSDSILQPLLFDYTVIDETVINYENHEKNSIVIHRDFVYANFIPNNYKDLQFWGINGIQLLKSDKPYITKMKLRKYALSAFKKNIKRYKTNKKYIIYLIVYFPCINICNVYLKDFKIL